MEIWGFFFYSFPIEATCFGPVAPPAPPPNGPWPSLREAGRGGEATASRTPLRQDWRKPNPVNIDLNCCRSLLETRYAFIFANSSVGCHWLDTYFVVRLLFHRRQRCQAFCRQPSDLSWVGVSRMRARPSLKLNSLIERQRGRESLQLVIQLRIQLINY